MTEPTIAIYTEEETGPSDTAVNEVKLSLHGANRVLERTAGAGAAAGGATAEGIGTPEAPENEPDVIALLSKADWAAAGAASAMAIAATETVLRMEHLPRYTCIGLSASGRSAPTHRHAPRS